MGQTLQTFASGRDQEEKEIDSILDSCYQKLKDLSTSDKDLSTSDVKFYRFYLVVCKTVGEINEKVGSTQFRVPEEGIIKDAFKKHHKGSGKLTKDEFKNILKDVIIKTKVTGTGGKDLILYIFGVPMAASWINQRVSPKPISNDILIPVVTSATVFVLAQLKKI